MANTAQARKRARQAVKLNAHNSSQRSTLRTAIKAVRKAIESGDKASAAQVFQASVSVIDRIADKRIIHKNKAANNKSKLTKYVNALK
jgi:small subunit ribosomal protein S20